MERYFRCYSLSESERMVKEMNNLNEMAQLVPSDKKYPVISVKNRGRSWNEFTKKELKHIKSQFDGTNLTIKKVGPLSFSLMLGSDLKYHFEALDNKSNRKVAIMIYDTPLYYEGQLSLINHVMADLSRSKKHTDYLILIYSTNQLPKDYRYYLSSTPMVKLELALSWVYQLIKFEYESNLNKELNSGELGSAVKRYTGNAMPLGEFSQNIGTFQRAINELRDIPDSTRYSKQRLNNAIQALGLYFGNYLHTDIRLKWNIGPDGDPRTMNILPGYYIEPFTIVEDAIEKGDSLEEIYNDIVEKVKKNVIPQYAKPIKGGELKNGI